MTKKIILPLVAVLSLISASAIANTTTSPVTAFPEPGSMLLLGIAFFGLAIYSKRSKNV